MDNNNCSNNNNGWRDPIDELMGIDYKMSDIGNGNNHKVMNMGNVHMTENMQIQHNNRTMIGSNSDDQLGDESSFCDLIKVDSIAMVKSKRAFVQDPDNCDDIDATHCSDAFINTVAQSDVNSDINNDINNDTAITTDSIVLDSLANTTTMSRSLSGKRGRKSSLVFI